MRRSDFDEFGEMLDAVCSLLSRGAYQPSPSNTAMFFRALARHELAAVRAGFDAHVADPVRGKFPPVPADIIAQLQSIAADDGRLGADEAWAIAVSSADEAVTVVWTDEIAQAWGVVRSIFNLGDEVGARVAFRDAYNRMVAEARREARPPKWSTALGLDKRLQDDAARAAFAVGRLSAPDGPLLEGPAVSIQQLAGRAPPHARIALARLRESLTTRGDVPSPDATARDDTARRKAETAARVAAYGEQST